MPQGLRSTLGIGLIYLGRFPYLYHVKLYINPSVACKTGEKLVSFFPPFVGALVTFVSGGPGLSSVLKTFVGFKVTKLSLSQLIDLLSCGIKS